MYFIPDTEHFYGKDLFDVPINSYFKEDGYNILINEDPISRGNNEDLFDITENRNDTMIEYGKQVVNEEKKNKKDIISESNKTVIGRTSAFTNFQKNGKIFTITKELKQKKFAGRKRKNNMGGKHNKFCNDNLTRKLKSKLFGGILSLLNSSTKGTEINDLQNNLQKKISSKPFFLKIDQEIIKDINVNSNKNLLKCKLKYIFSNNVCKKVGNYGLDFNKKLIEKIYKENTQTKTISILEKNFLECLEHFRGSKYYIELEGLEKEFQNVINEFKNNGETNEYIEIFVDFMNRFEEYYEKKTARPLKNKK